MGRYYPACLSLKSCLVVTMLCLLSGCGVGYNTDSGGDARRSAAQDVNTDEPLDDRVSAKQGDHTDWKRFELPTSASLTLRFWWDDPSVRASVQLRDEHGSLLHEAVHQSSRAEEIFGPVDLGPGAYFLQIEAASGASVYTFRLD
ncbi:MAG: hypothetical protein VX938_01640, partial [Myxococcota bacterium]|nr:hypothetical protein [Myxococcota bacterium]